MKRVLLKISGEALAGEQHFSINEEMTRKVAASKAIMTLAYKWRS
ncbi:MAG: hypothetical protein ACLSFO_03990 [Anaerovoracaceae bacterium]